MIVTFDTNVFVSGFVRPEGRAAQVLANIVAGRDELFASPFIIDELKRVLTNKFGWTIAELVEIDTWFSTNARIVIPSITVDVLSDEPDNRILECAVAANVEAIVTGDRQMLALRVFGMFAYWPSLITWKRL